MNDQENEIDKINRTITTGMVYNHDQDNDN